MIGIGIVNMVFSNNLKRENFVYIDTSKKTPKEQLLESHLAYCLCLLIQKSALKHLRIYAVCDRMYIYLKTAGYYKEIKTAELEIIIHSLLVDIVGRNLVKATYVKAIILTMKMDSTIAFMGELFVDSGYYVFAISILNLSNNKLISWTPDIFVGSSVSYPYDKDATCPEFMNYLHSFTSGDVWKQQLIRCFVKILLMSAVMAQKFMYIVGSGSTGKTSFAQLLTTLVGKEATLTTGLKSL